MHKMKIIINMYILLLYFKNYMEKKLH